MVEDGGVFFGRVGSSARVRLSGDVASRLTSISQQMAKDQNAVERLVSDEDGDDEDTPIDQVALHLAQDGNKPSSAAEPKQPATKTMPKVAVAQPMAQPAKKEASKPTSSDDSSEELAVHEDEEQTSADDE